jgi:hypothetical protein
VVMASAGTEAAARDGMIFCIQLDAEKEAA